METSDRSTPSHPSSSHLHIHFADEMRSNGGRKRVGFHPDAAPPDDSFRPSPRPFGESPPEAGSRAVTPPPPVRTDISHDQLAELSESVHKAFSPVPDNAPQLPRPRPAIRRATRTPPQFQAGGDNDEEVQNVQKMRSGVQAQQRANRLARSVGTSSAPISRRNSQERLISPHFEEIPLDTYGSETAGESTDEEDNSKPKQEELKKGFLHEADELLRQHAVGQSSPIVRPDDFFHSETAALRSGAATPINHLEVEDEYVPRPAKFRTGVLGTILKANNAANTSPTDATRNPKNRHHARNLSSTSTIFSAASTAVTSPNATPPHSGTSTPVHPHGRIRPWYSKSANASTSTIGKLLVESGSAMATPANGEISHDFAEKWKKGRPGLPKRKSTASLASAFSKFSKGSRDEQIKIKIHLADTLARQTYLRRLCKALMMYGAPTHRLEDYMNRSARVLEIEAQFLYIPGCMIISFDDSSVHTTEVKLVRVAQGVDLGKLRDVHEIYKDVVHDRIGVEEATTRLDDIIAQKPKFSAWLRIPVYGLASASVGPFAFQARPIDLPFCFILGCVLGWLQLIVAPGNELIGNVFEISAAVITSFIARGLGSIKHNGEEMFCFSAMAQSSIALILPGFTVLCASLELQSRSIVAGSVRMVYAIIYSLFLGFGITIGTVLFGIMYKDATSATSCTDPMDSRYYYLFVLAFSLSLMIINQAKWKQMPSMVVIALIGYVVNFNSSQYFKGNAQVSNTLGALAIGVSANLHARFGRHVENKSLDIWETYIRPRIMKLRKRYMRRTHGRSSWPAPLSTSSPRTPDSPFIPHTRKVGYGLAAAMMLPAIFVQVPSGLSVSGSLVAGITSADQITRNMTGITTMTNGTDTATTNMNSVALKVGFSVIQIAIGITVGLFLAALLVYPLGKKRSGLFSF